MHRRSPRRALVALALLFATGAAADIVHGPTTYRIEHGKPQLFVQQFAVTEQMRCGGRSAFILVVENGNTNAESLVTSAAVSVNDDVLVGEHDFSAAANRIIERPFVATSTNIVTVELKGGRPGSFLTVSIRREVGSPILLPEQVVLTKAGATHFSRSFASPGQGQYILEIANGVGQTGRVANATLVLNGATVVTKSDINQKIPLLRRTIELASTNVLDLEIVGVPDDRLTISIVKETSPTVCSSLRVFIQEPVPGATVEGSRVRLRGTAEGGTDIGVTVNGYAAEVALDHLGTAADPFVWFADLPVQPGAVDLEVTVTDLSGNTARARRNIVIAGSPSTFLELHPDTYSGTAPLTVTYRLVVPDEFQASGYEFDLDGDGTFELSRASLEEPVRFTYQQPGIYKPRVRTIGLATPKTADVMIVAHSLATIHAVLSSAWNHFTAALAAGDVTAALGSLAGERTRRKYAAPLTAIRDDLPAYVESIESFRPMWIGGRLAHYRLVRLEGGRRYAYHVYLARDASGVWKVMQF